MGLRFLKCCTAQACGWFPDVLRHHTGPEFKGRVIGPLDLCSEMYQHTHAQHRRTAKASVTPQRVPETESSQHDLISNFRRVLPTFRNTLFHFHRQVGVKNVLLHTYLPMMMEQCSETSAYKIQTPGNYPEESIQQHYTCLFIHLSSSQIKTK